MVSKVHSANMSNMAAVAASQSAPPETRCREDTAGPVLRINNFYRINLDVPGPTCSIRCLHQCPTSFLLVPLVAEAALLSSSFKVTADNR